MANLLGLGAIYGSHSELLLTAIRHVSWVNGPYLTTGVFFGHCGSVPVTTMKSTKIIMGIRKDRTSLDQV